MYLGISLNQVPSCLAIRNTLIQPDAARMKNDILLSKLLQLLIIELEASITREECKVCVKPRIINLVKGGGALF